MSRPPPSPTSPSVHSLFHSEDSLHSAQTDEEVGSARIQVFFESFDAAERFSQIGPDPGRGVQVVREMHALLMNIWMRRDQSHPDLCIDKHDGRPGRTIYYPPQRQPGGIVHPCRLVGTEHDGGQHVQNVNIVHHHISVHAENRKGDSPTEPKPQRSLKHQKVQTHFKSLSQQKPLRNRNRGRFVKRTLASVSETATRVTSIPLAPRGIEDVLRQWVQGDASEGLDVPLCQFTYEMINGKDSTGKKHKSLYSKRKTVSVAVLLALRESKEKGKPFGQVFSLEPDDRNVQNISMTKWEKYARQYLKEGRKMSTQDIIDLGREVYKTEYLELLK